VSGSPPALASGRTASEGTAARRRRPHEAREPGQTVAGSTLAQEVRNALESDAANTSMLDVVSPDRGELTDLELDLTDWGFTYGVAWARARERRAGEIGDAGAQEALSAAEDVFRDYTRGAGWTQDVEERLAQRPAQANASAQNGSRDGRKTRRRRLFRSRR